MGGGGFLGLGPAPSAPAAPNYTQAAQATAAGNMIGQNTPYGSLAYNQTGTDASGNPMYTATTTLSQPEQNLLNSQLSNEQALQSFTPSVLGQVQNNVTNGFNPNIPGINYSAGQTPALQANAGGTGLQGWNQATQDVMSSLQPQLNQQSETLANNLAQQGIQPGTQAYNNAMQLQGVNQNNLLAQASLTGANVQNNLVNQSIGVQNANNSALNQQYANQLSNAQLGNQANQQGYSQAMTNYNLPLNTLSALQSGSQVQNPSFTSTPAGPNYSAAAASQYGAQMGNFNAQNAAQSNLNSGLFGLGGAAIMASDIRVKENIKEIGKMHNGLGIYSFEYKPEFKNEAGHGKFIGVMAQEVEKIMPEAVITRHDGYKMVNYGMLNG